MRKTGLRPRPPGQAAASPRWPPAVTLRHPVARHRLLPASAPGVAVPQSNGGALAGLRTCAVVIEWHDWTARVLRA